MPRGDKSSYTNRQKRMAAHIEKGYERRGVPEDEAERRAWATVNAETHGGKKSGSGRGKKENHAPARKVGKLGSADPQAPGRLNTSSCAQALNVSGLLATYSSQSSRIMRWTSSGLYSVPCEGPL